MDGKQRAIEAAKASGFDGEVNHLRRRKVVGAYWAVDAVEFTEGVERAVVTLCVPYTEVPSLLSPLTLEMVKVAFAGWLSHENERRVQALEFPRFFEEEWTRLESFLRQQIEGGAQGD